MDTATIVRLDAIGELRKVAQTVGLKGVSEKIAQWKREERLKGLNPAELDLLRRYEAVAEKRSDFNKELKNSYFNADTAKKYAQQVMREYFGYDSKVKFSDIDPEKLRPLFTKAQLGRYDAKPTSFSIIQFYKGLKSHNLVLKVLKGNKDHVPEVISPVAYKSALINLAFYTKDKFEKVKARKL